VIFTSNHWTDTDKQSSTYRRIHHKLNKTQNTAKNGPENETGLFYKFLEHTRASLSQTAMHQIKGND